MVTLGFLSRFLLGLLVFLDGVVVVIGCGVVGIVGAFGASTPTTRFGFSWVTAWFNLPWFQFNFWNFDLFCFCSFFLFVFAIFCFSSFLVLFLFLLSFFTLFLFSFLLIFVSALIFCSLLHVSESIWVCWLWILVLVLEKFPHWFYVL